jgi:hypothetical protein
VLRTVTMIRAAANAAMPNAHRTRRIFILVILLPFVDGFLSVGFLQGFWRVRNPPYRGQVRSYPVNMAYNNR